MEIQYIGENLLPGKIGQFFIILSFCTALLATISYYFATTTNLSKDYLVRAGSDGWKRIARIAFLINIAAVLGIGSSLYFIIYNHLFEYHYAWAHSSKILPVYYIISSFWEGQEGSFWLWMLWQAVLGFVILRKGKNWEN